MLHSFSQQPEIDRRQKYLGALLSDAGHQVILAESTPDLDVEATEIPEASEEGFTKEK